MANTDEMIRQDLSLVEAPGVKIEYIHTKFFVWMHSILTPDALQTEPLANTGHTITSQTSHWSKHRGTNKMHPLISLREHVCLPFAGFF